MCAGSAKEVQHGCDCDDGLKGPYASASRSSSFMAVRNSRSCGECEDGCPFMGNCRARCNIYS